MALVLAWALGNLLAIAVHAVTWKMRRDLWGLWALITLGVLWFILFVVTVHFSTHWHGFDMNGSSIEDTTKNAANDDMQMFAIIGSSLLLTSLGGLLQMKQIPTTWWNATVALWGETSLWVLTCILGSFLLGPFPFAWIVDQTFLTGFIATASILAFMRPLCLRWARPLWQIFKEMRPGEVEKTAPH